MSINKQNPTRPFKGMHQDTSPIDQPKGSYTVAWNAINETSDGNNNFVSNEQSNELCGQLPVGYRPIGDVYISDDSIVVFSTDGTNSEIGIIDAECQYTTVVNNTCLNFQITNQISAVFRVRRGCDRTIYFTDGLNPVRYFNLDKPDDFKDAGGDWDCDLFRLFLGFQNPCFDTFELLEQGTLESGTYAFALQYLDRDLNPTKYSYISQPVPIFATPLTEPYNNIIGSSNLDTDELGGSNPTNKAIKVFLTDLDDTYEFYRYVVVESTSFNGTVTRALVSSEIPIQQTEFVYDGNTEGFTEVDINEIRIQPQSVETAQHIEQLENRLILGNITGRPLDFCSFQASASQITSRYAVKRAPATDELESGNSKDPNTYWDARGYMGDEVYAFGIVYVFSDGFESPAYHIPGTDETSFNCSPCVESSGVLNCLRIRENEVSGLISCPETSTSYTVNYKLDGVQQQYTHTINTTDDVRGWVEIICTSQKITDISVIVENNDCTGLVDEFLPLEYTAVAAPIGDPLWFSPIQCDLPPLQNLYNPFIYFYARERVTTTCVGGLPVAPAGAGWMLLIDDCAGTNTADWVRESTALVPPLDCSVFQFTSCTGASCVPDPPPSTGEHWYEKLYTPGPTGSISYWVDASAFFPPGIEYTSQVVNIICPREKILTWSGDIAHIYPNEAEYNALPLEDKLETWEIFNTASPITTDSGYMSYWESKNSVYPTLLDCEGKDFWGNDACGNPLAGQPIRHHKFPDRNLIPHLVSDSQGPAYESQLIIEIQYNGDQAQLDALLQEQFPGDPNKSELLTVTYDLDGVTQTSIDIRLYANDFIWDGAAFEPIQRTIVTRTGTTTQGIDNLVYTNAFGTDPNTVINNISTINGEEVAPDANLEINILGIKFDNITYPHPDIVGHYIVRGDRDEANRTVVDKGISNSCHSSGAKGIDYTLFSYFAGGPTDTTTGLVFNQDGTRNYLFTPSMLFENDPPDGAYMKQEQQFLHVHSLGLGNLSSPEEFDNLTEFGAGVGNSAVFGTGYATLSSTRKMTYSGMRTVKPPVKLRGINKSVLLNGLTFDDNFYPNRRLYNVSHTNRVQIVELASPSIHSEQSYDIPYVSIKIDRDIHPNLFAINYYRTHNCVLKNNEENIVFGGDTFIAPMELSNTFFYQFNDSVWDTVLIIAAIVVAIVATVFTAGAAAGGVAAGIAALGGTLALTAVQTGVIVAAIVAGAIGITAASIDQAIKSYRESGLQEVITEDSQIQTFSYSTKNFMEYCNEHISGIYVETTLNLGLRQDHTIYRPGEFYRGQSDIRAYFRDRIVVYDNDATEKKDVWVHRGTVVPEVYHYNPDFSRFNKDNVYVPLPESYDCCSNCLEVFPTRVQYSEQSFQEESVDNFRVFLANNYRDIEAEKGEITNIFRKHNNLFIHTEEALWQLPQNIQERITGDLVSFIGTGEYFSIPPRLILDDEIGSAGSMHKWATIKTDMGVFFIDASNRTMNVLSTNGGIKAISNEGLRNFFKENLISFLENQYYSLTGEQFLNINNPANPNGVGYNSVYDTRHSRIIFTKRDYKILSDYTSNFIEVASVGGAITGIVDGQLFFDITTRQFGIGTGVDTYNYITLGDPTYFENKSWTISYSLLNNTWTSFHSYIPLFYSYIHNTFYSFIDNGIWKHNKKGHYQTFYGTRYPHILEYVSLSSPVITRLWDDITLQTMSRMYDSTTKQFIDTDTIFNKGIFWNSKQCSGLLNFLLKVEDENYLNQQIVKGNMNDVLINRDERDWHVNEIRDYRIDYNNSIWSKEWSSLQSEFPIDKVLNASTIDFNKIWTDLQPLRDKYLIIRLIFDNFDNVNLITNYSLERETKSF